MDAMDSERQLSVRYGQNDPSIVLGRRNWLFSDTPNGAHASANLYSMIETAKASGHEPYRYLRHLFTELPKASSPEHLAALLPFNVSPADIQHP